jgi:YihY family inner membrane protein
MAIGDAVDRAAKRVDALQQRFRPSAFVVGVLKKFGDDQGGNYAAQLTYYGFVSLFPLLLVLVTVLGYVLQDNPKLQSDIIDSAVADLPVIGDQIRTNVHSLHGNGIGLVIGLLVILYGGLGLANAAQDAMNRVWEVPIRSRAGFFPRLLRSLALIGTLGVGILVTTFLSRFGAANANLAMESRAVLYIGGVLLNVGLFTVAFIVLTSRSLGWRDVLPGAIVAAIGWEILQAIGAWFVQRQLNHMSPTYGLFAIVIGLLLWIFLEARVVLYAAEVNVVRAQRLWPRSLTPPPFTEADRRAFEAYAVREERHPDEVLNVDLSQ